MVRRSENRRSVLTPREALRSPFPGGDHLFLATSTPRSRGAFLIALRQCEPCSRGGGILCRTLRPCSLGFLAFDDVHGHARTIAHPLRLHSAAQSNHVNDPRGSHCVGSETLALIRSPSPAWRAGDSRLFEGGSDRDRVPSCLSAPRYGGLQPLPIVSPSALLARVSPSSVDRPPRDESLGNAGGFDGRSPSFDRVS